MVSGTAIALEAGSAPEFEHTTRHAFRAAVDQVALNAKATLPESSGRVDKAVQIVLQGDVEICHLSHKFACSDA